MTVLVPVTSPSPVIVTVALPMFLLFAYEAYEQAEQGAGDCVVCWRRLALRGSAGACDLLVLVACWRLALRGFLLSLVTCWRLALRGFCWHLCDLLALGAAGVSAGACVTCWRRWGRE